MTSSMLTVDSTLEDWRSVRERYEWTGLLVGNGASCAVWKGFDYTSLLQVAQDRDDVDSLSREDLTVFSALRTTNFETVLASLRTADVISQALGQDSSLVGERYQSIQGALVAAVHKVHVPFGRLSNEVLEKMQDAVSPYWRVYSTNYDLLLYWAIMRERKAVLRDYFWSGSDTRFDIANTQPYPGSHTILYLHGGLHLVRTLSGETKKLTSDRGKLLDQFGSLFKEGYTPLVVTEGTADDKLASIRRSDYLSFAYQQFARHEGPVVVFGHRLAESDAHIVRVMREWDERQPLAISLRRSDERSLIARKAELHKLLGRNNLIFFDAATHPLGSPDLALPFVRPDVMAPARRPARQ